MRAAHGRSAPHLAAAVLACLLGTGCRRETPQAAHGVATSLAAIVATCAAVVGDVEVKRVGKEDWARVTTGAVLREGDAIRTLPGGFARVEFLSGNGVELEERTTAVVDVAARAAVAGAASPAADRIALQGGVARGSFAEGAGRARGPLTVRTPDGREATLVPEPHVKGVRFRLTATAKGTEIAITSGAASVAGPAGAVALRAGTAVDLAAEGLGTPVELIGFPESLEPHVDARLPLDPAVSIPLRWSRVERARGYRVQVARDLSFRQVLLVRDVEGLAATLEPAEEGLYAWRVAARDGEGRLGEYGFARRLFCDARPSRDLLGAPADGAVVHPAPGATVRFAWQADPAARGYRLVVASSPELTEREVRSASTAAPAAEVGDLAPGVYFWGVYVDDARREPLFVRPRRLVVERPLQEEVRVPPAIREWGR